MFLGASGEPLTSWRQWIGSSGEQTIISKPAGDLLVPRDEIYWRKIRESVTVKAKEVKFDTKNLWIIVPIVAIAGILLYLGLKK